MDLLEAIKSRRSIREYLAQDVEDEKLNTILEAARWAPSAGNKQPWHFIIVKDSKMRKQLGKMHPHGRWMKDSPVVIVVLGNPYMHPKYHLCDPHQAIQNMLLTAHSLGLGTCWMGVRDTTFEQDFKDLLGVPKHMRVICTISLGYSKQKRTSSRFPLSEMVSWEHYGRKR